MKLKALLIKIFFSLAILAALAEQINLDQVNSIAHEIHPLSWLYAMVFITLQIAALAVRWLFLVNVGPKKIMGFDTSFRIASVSFLANYLFITSIGGIVSRIGLTMAQGFSFVKSLAATLIDRGMTLLALLILGVALLPFLIIGLPFENNFTALIITLLAGIMILPFLYWKRRLIIFINRKITVCFKYMLRLLTDPVRLLKIVAISIISQLLYFTAAYAVVSSLNNVSLIEFMAIMPLITLISSLPVGYGGWGVREGAFIYGLGLIHIAPEAAFVASIQIGIISMLTALLAGVPSFFHPETQSIVRNLRIRKKPHAAHAA